MRGFLARQGSAYPSLVDPGSRTAIAYGVFGVPETYFIDAEGRIAAKHIGPLDAAVACRRSCARRGSRHEAPRPGRGRRRCCARRSRTPQQEPAAAEPAGVVGAPRGQALAGAALDARTEDVGRPAALPGVPGAVGGRLARHHGGQHEGPGEGAAGAGLRPGADPRVLRELLRRVRAPRAAAARRELAGVARAAAGPRRRRRDRRVDAALATAGGGRPDGRAAARARHAARRSRARPLRAARPRARLRLARRPSAREYAPDAALRSPVAAGPRRAAGRPRARRAPGVVGAAAGRAGPGCRPRGPAARAARPRRPGRRSPASAARARRHGHEAHAGAARARAVRARARGRPRAPGAGRARHPRPPSPGRRPSRRLRGEAPPAASCGACRAPPPWRRCCSWCGDRRRSAPREAA